jgi:hypothetical protein
MQRPVAGLLLFAFALASCAELAWRKEGADNAGLDQDLSACSKLAQERTARMWGIAPPVSTDARFGPIGPSAAEIRLQESQAVTTCMKAKGYVLVPVGK